MGNCVRRRGARGSFGTGARCAGLCHRLGGAVPSCAAAVVAARADRRRRGSGPGRSSCPRREHLLRAVPRAVHRPASVQRGSRDEPSRPVGEQGLHSVAGRGACAAHGACGGLRVELVRALYPVGCRLRLRRRPGPHRCRRCGRTRVVGQPEEASVDAALRRVAHQRRVRRCRLPIRQCRRPHRGFLGPRCR